MSDLIPYFSLLLYIYICIYIYVYIYTYIYKYCRGGEMLFSPSFYFENLKKLQYS